MREIAWKALGQSFVTLLVILDPLGNIPLFLALTRDEMPRARHRAAYVAILVAGAVLLFLVALDMMRGTQSRVLSAEDTSVALVPLAMPFLAGPGATVATIVLNRQRSFIARLVRPSAPRGNTSSRLQRQCIPDTPSFGRLPHG
jgi:small neutral amino acid transporter SnatA (MarC family)